MLKQALHTALKRESVAPKVAALFRQPSATLAHVLVVILAEERLLGLLRRRAS